VRSRPAGEVATELLQRFDELFPDERSCERYLAALRWPDGPRCPRCPVDPASFPNPSGRGWWCRHCRRSFTVTAGTALGSSKLPLRTWVHAVALVVARQGLSARALASEEGVSYRTAELVLRRMREALGRAEALERASRPGTPHAVSIAPAATAGPLAATRFVIAVPLYGIRGKQAVQQTAFGKVLTERELAGWLAATFEPGRSVLFFSPDALERQVASRLGFSVLLCEFGDDDPARAMVHWLESRHGARVEVRYLQGYLDEFLALVHAEKDGRGLDRFLAAMLSGPLSGAETEGHG